MKTEREEEMGKFVGIFFPFLLFSLIINYWRYWLMVRNFKTTTFRHCYVCGKVTKWQYNKNIGHSECFVCGCRFGKKLEESTD